MRVFVPAIMLLVSSTLSPSFAQDQGKAPIAAPQAGPAPGNQNASPQQEQRSGSDQPRAENREVGRDDRDRDERQVGRDWRMHSDRGSDMDRDRYRERGDRDRDREDRYSHGRGYYDEDRSRRRVKVCIEYENGDEYCRYRE